MNVLQGRPVPVFPLPNVVLFPRVLLPLYVFEPRYREMLAHSLDSHGRIAIALLKPGWEPDYYGEPETHDVVCVGAIVNYRTREDGTSDVVLVGESRARVVDWISGMQYRRAKLHPMVPRKVPSTAVAENLTRRLNGWVRATQSGKRGNQLDQLQKLFADERDPGFLADFLASRIIAEPENRQSLLEELDVERRVSRVEKNLRERGLL